LSDRTRKQTAAEVSSSSSSSCCFRVGGERGPEVKAIYMVVA
jgi:hypothetical protein